MPKYFGKYRGVVLDIADPQERGRLKARVPSILGDTPSSWALPCIPYMEGPSDTISVPPVGTTIWIEFEGGDLSFPIWSGVLYRPSSPPDCLLC